MHTEKTQRRFLRMLPLLLLFTFYLNLAYPVLQIFPSPRFIFRDLWEEILLSSSILSPLKKNIVGNCLTLIPAHISHISLLAQISRLETLGVEDCKWKLNSPTRLISSRMMDCRLEFNFYGQFFPLGNQRIVD